MDVESLGRVLIKVKFTQRSDRWDKIISPVYREFPEIILHDHMEVKRSPQESNFSSVNLLIIRVRGPAFVVKTGEFVID